MILPRPGSPAKNSARALAIRIAGVVLALPLVAVAARATPQISWLEDPLRPESERLRDAGTRPLEIYAWLGIEAGMTVGDVIPAAGYNSHLLARLVGDHGKVIAAYTDAQSAARLQRRFAEADLDNVDVLTHLGDVPDRSVDTFLSVRNIHDLFIPEAAARYGLDREAILADVLRSLKPGGVFGVVDARTPKEGVDDVAHRINEGAVIRELEARGFELVDRSDMLAVPDDDFEAGGYPTRWNVDRMLLKFRKPLD